MSTPSEMLAKIESIDVELLMQVAMEITAETAVEQQRLQLQQGLRSDETHLPDYAPSSVAKGKPPGPIRLFDKGDFYKGFLLDVRNDIFILVSSDRKCPMLQEKYNQNILALASAAKNNWIKVIDPVFQNLVRNELL